MRGIRSVAQGVCAGCLSLPHGKENQPRKPRGLQHLLHNWCSNFTYPHKHIAVFHLGACLSDRMLPSAQVAFLRSLRESQYLTCFNCLFSSDCGPCRIRNFWDLVFASGGNSLRDCGKASAASDFLPTEVQGISFVGSTSEVCCPRPCGTYKTYALYLRRIFNFQPHAAHSTCYDTWKKFVL